VVNEATNRRVLAHARDQLAKVRSRVVGAVLNNFGPATSYYYYADYYAYTSSYYYEQEPGERRRRRRSDRKSQDGARQLGRLGRRARKSESNGHGPDQEGGFGSGEGQPEQEPSVRTFFSS
jgi:Mrp family chromosome partitioning ATPase